MKKNIIRLCVLCVCFSGVVMAQAPTFPGAAAPPRISTPTRQVAVFSGLEEQWMNAIQQKDQGALGRLLTDDFELWIAGSNDPLPQEDFLAAVKDQLKVQSFRIGQLSVHTYPNVAVVNFMLSAKAQYAGKERSGNYFVVDVWQQNGDKWQLAVRYLSRTGNVPEMHARPTGKE